MDYTERQTKMRITQRLSHCLCHLSMLRTTGMFLLISLNCESIHYYIHKYVTQVCDNTDKFSQSTASTEMRIGDFKALIPILK